ncbi:MAG: hypothetical protein Q4A32_05635 [Lachnospiraceae bacterium]|nr:hypothetical protein [Lachnospiraceae bacterium]
MKAETGVSAKTAAGVLVEHRLLFSIEYIEIISIRIAGLPLVQGRPDDIIIVYPLRQKVKCMISVQNASFPVQGFLIQLVPQHLVAMWCIVPGCCGARWGKKTAQEKCPFCTGIMHIVGWINTFKLKNIIDNKTDLR